MDRIYRAEGMTTMLATSEEQSAPRQAQAERRAPRAFALLARRERWSLTLFGWLLLGAGLAGLFFVLVSAIHPFLAPTKREPASILVIEGWLPDYALMEGWAEFQRGGYATLLTSGGLVRSGYNLSAGDTYAELAAKQLLKFARTEQAVAVPAAEVDHDRTFSSAVAIRNWLAANCPQERAIDVVSLGTHARRTRLIYEKAFGPGVPVGIVAIQDREYDPLHWWRYSEGVKEIVSETAAYFYATVLFHPGARPARHEQAPE